MMMCLCVLILPVCFTRPHGMFLVLYRVTNHMAGPPPLTERNWYIYTFQYKHHKDLKSLKGVRVRLHLRHWLAAGAAP